MKIFTKLIYALIFGILGATLSVLIFVSLCGTTVSILYMCLFGDGDWPKWAQLILVTSSNEIVFISIYLIGFLVGMFYGSRYVINFKKSHLWLKWGGLAAGIIVAFFTVHTIISKKKIANEKQNAKLFQMIINKKHKISNVLIDESQNGLVLNISTEGSLSGKYKLFLDCNTNMAKNFFIKNDTARISSSNETIKVIIDYRDLEIGLRKQLEMGGRIVSFGEKFGANETMVIRLGLKLLDDNERYLSKLRDLVVPEDIKTIKGEISYYCHKDSCKITNWTL